MLTYLYKKHMNAHQNRHYQTSTTVNSSCFDIIRTQKKEEEDRTNV
jgi:hypothetical protein